MAEKEGIGSLPYYEDPEALELARKASEQMMSQEMELEFDQELPPEMRTGGIYALFSDLGKSVPGLKYHSFNTVPVEARADFEGQEDYRKQFTFDGLRRVSRYEYPKVTTGENRRSILGLFVPESIKKYKDQGERDARKKFFGEKGAPKYASSNPFKINYLSPIGGVADKSDAGKLFVGERLANMEDQSFQAYDVEPDKTYPGFLTGPSLPSVNVELNEALLPFPKYQTRRANTFQHELMHAGAYHPRFQSFLRSEDFRDLPSRVKKDFFEMNLSQHSFTGPLERYAENYRRGAERNVVQFTLENADALLSPDALNQGLDQEGQDTAILMLQAIEKGGDPLHQYARRVGFDEADRKVLNDLETMSFYFGEYLNRTADPETGKQAYTAVKKLEEKVPR